MVGATDQNGLSRGHDVPASVADTRMDRERYRAASERGFYLAKPFPRQQCPLEEYKERFIIVWLSRAVSIEMILSNSTVELRDVSSEDRAVS
jgi:hypothetical protein